MRYLLFCIVIFSILLCGCDKSRMQELEQKNADLQKRYDNLTRDVTTQSQYIDDVTKAINSVYGNMQKITEQELLLSKSTKELEIGKAGNQTQLRERILSQIAGIDTFLVNNKKKLNDLESKISSNNKKYEGLQQMVENLKKTIVEKEQSIARLEKSLNEMNVKVQSLEEMLAQKTESEKQKEEVITTQKKVINSSFYIIGTREELEEKGIISYEGGVLWGLFGKTTLLSNGFDPSAFIAIDKYEHTTIEIPGKIDEVIPKRRPNYYTMTEEAGNSKMLIIDPDRFWQEQYLVIITK